MRKANTMEALSMRTMKKAAYSVRSTVFALTWDPSESGTWDATRWVTRESTLRAIKALCDER